MYRIGSVCFIYINGYTFSNGSNTFPITLPIGYRPVMGFYVPASDPNADTRFRINQDGTMSAYNYGSSNNNVVVSTTYLTIDNPPS